MNNKVWFYQNNPCVIVRDVNEQFAEIQISHHFADDMELTGQCIGCNVGDSDNKLSCTCDEHSWIIEEVQAEENRVLCIVEKRLLNDQPIEQGSIDTLNTEILKLRNEFNETRTLHEEWRQSIKNMKATKEGLNTEINNAQLQVEAMHNIRKASEMGLEKLQKRYDEMLVNVTSYGSRVRKTVSWNDYAQLLSDQSKLKSIESGVNA